MTYRAIAGPLRRWRPSCLSKTDVDCWIGVVQEIDRRIVRVAGRLGAAQVPELLRACADTGPVQVDLTELVSADMAGVEAIQRVRAGGARLTGVPTYIQMKLDSPGGAHPGSPASKTRRDPSS